MNPVLAGVQKLSESSSEAINYMLAFQQLSHSALLGLLLMVLTAWVSKNSASVMATTDELPMTPSERIFSAANVMYLCFGMTGMMLLVNNNIARAFAIAAAIALVRFRIKVNSKILSMSLFYGVLTGMACGVGYVFIGYILVVFFGVLQLVVLAAAKLSDKKEVSSQNKVRPLFATELKTQSFYEPETKGPM